MSKTRVNRKLPSVGDLIREHSTARYTHAVRGVGARTLRRIAVNQQVQKYR